LVSVAAKVVGPSITYLVKAMVEQPQGAGTVADPVRPENRIRPPGQRAASQLTRRLAQSLLQRVDARLKQLRSNDFRAMSEEDWLAAIEAAATTLRTITPITISHAIEMNLLPDAIAAKAIAADPERPLIAGLGDNGTAMYRRLIAECSAHIVEFVTQRPEFSKRVEVELVRRTAEIQNGIDSLKRSNRPPDDHEFERRYGDLVRRKLNNLQLFGVTLRRGNTYSLSTAYLSLRATAEGSVRRRREKPQRSIGGERLGIDEALAGETRVLIRGEAGSGKTTLLQWLAVNSARTDGSLPQGWGQAVPFFVPLRRFARRDLPAPTQLPREVAPALSSEAPADWVQRVLRSGRGLVLVDGVDELPSSKRNDVWIWLGDLIATYPESRYVITSRPPAADANLLVPDTFRTFMLLPMGTSEVRAFVGQWHSAMRNILGERDERWHYRDTNRSYWTRSPSVEILGDSLPTHYCAL
jgi:hypothetical protein